jgi:S-adenosylmethionine:diacylglycerol 3-amino-3-carboxypropyl transferase
LSDSDQQRAAFTHELAILEHSAKNWFGRARVAGPARDGAQFRTAGTIDVGEQFWRRFADVATRLPARSNPFLEWLLTGQYHRLSAAPPFLRPSNFGRLRAAASRVTIVRSSLEEFLASRPPRSFGAANLSDALDYLSDDEALELMTLLVSRMRSRGRIAHWNLFGERCAFPPRSADRVRRLGALGADLFQADRVPFYSGFEVGEATPARPFAVI